MLSQVILLIKTHKLTTLLLLVVLYFVFVGFKTNAPFSPLLSRTQNMSYSTDSYGVAPVSAPARGKVSESFDSSIISPRVEFAPNAGISNRMVIQNSYLSLLVKDVLDVRKKILDYASSLGGYMVNAETSNPQDAPSSTVTVRVPSEKLDAALETFRSWGVKVVSENLMGSDVTDQYIDIDARIETLEKTKKSMESILAQATQISDLANITREVISIQSQIDALKGSQKSLSENAKLAKVTIYLSTDEIALPYAPNESFRPHVIAKLAIRSLISHLRSAGALLIWVLVYSVIWLPILLVVWFLSRKFGKQKA